MMTMNTNAPSSPLDRPPAVPDVLINGVQVRHLMSTTPVTISPDTPVREAQRLMQQEQMNHLLVVKEGALLGILAERDVLAVLPSPATSLSKGEVLYLLDKLTVRQVMTTDLVTVTPDCPVSDAVRLMLAHRIGALPVVEAHQVVGILTQRDVLQAIIKAQVVTPVAA